MESDIFLQVKHLEVGKLNHLEVTVCMLMYNGHHMNAKVAFTYFCGGVLIREVTTNDTVLHIYNKEVKKYVHVPVAIFI